MARKLTAREVRRVCNPSSLGFESTEGLKPVQTIIGQSRALQALQFGLSIQNSGFNIYAAGLPGTEKMTAIVAFLELVAREKDVPPDWCYVHNFKDSYTPKALKLKAGTGNQFQKDMKKLIETSQTDIRKAFESEDYIKRRDAIAHTFNEKRETIFNQLNQMAHEKGFAIQTSPMGLMLIPIIDGKPLTEQEMLGLNPKEKERLSKLREQIQEQIKDAMAQMRNWDKEGTEQIEKMDEDVVRFVLGAPIEELTKKYGQDNPDVVEYLKAVEADITENKNIFRSSPEADASNPFARMAVTQTFRKYEVNVLVDNSHLKGAAVVIETNPTFSNLMGRLEKEAYFGAISGDFTMIRPGSLHKANGGYLVIRIDDLLRNLMS